MIIVLVFLFLPFLLLGSVEILKGRKLLGFGLLSVFGLAVFLIINPEVSSMIASQIGIGRGTDLIFYLFLPLSLTLHFTLFARMKALQRRVATLTREIALSNARQESEH